MFAPFSGLMWPRNQPQPVCQWRHEVRFTMRSVSRRTGRGGIGSTTATVKWLLSPAYHSAVQTLSSALSMYYLLSLHKLSIYTLSYNEDWSQVLGAWAKNGKVLDQNFDWLLFTWWLPNFQLQMTLVGLNSGHKLLWYQKWLDLISF